MSKVNIKKYVYIALFVLLGVLVNFLVHAGIETVIIELLVRDFARFSLGLSWDSWLRVHEIGAVVLLAGFAALGFQQGRYWWRRVYEGMVEAE